MRRLAAACWIVAGGGYLTLEAVAAAAFRPSYGYTTNFISDLGRPELSALAPVMNGAFYLQGTGFLAAAILVSRAERFSKTGLFVSLAATNAVGNFVVGTIHSGSWPHVAGAVLAIAGGNAAVLAGSSVLRRAGAPPWYRTASVGLAALGLTAFTALAVQTVAGNEIVPNAVLERVSVYTIIAWQVLSAVQVWPTRGARITLPS